MLIREFALERYFARHEFAAKHILAASDVEALSMSEVLAMADAETRSLWDGLRLGYTESAGLPLLRKEIAALYDGFSADDIVTFAGAEEGIFVAMHAALRSGDHVLAIVPAYQSLHEVARSAGAEVTTFDLDPSGWTLDVDAFLASIRANTRMVVINFPHNPTGAQLTLAQFTRIASACDDRGIMLFSDEVYRFLEHDPAALLPPAAALARRHVSLGVMSKSFALAGIRVGWIATRDADLRQRMAAIKDYTTICSSAPSEILAVIALRSRNSVIARSQRIVHDNLPVLGEFMSRHAGQIGWAPPRAGSTCFPRFLGGVDAGPVARRLVDDHGVVILPGETFGYDRSHFRVGFGRLDMRQGLAAFETVLKTL